MTILEQLDLALDIVDRVNHKVRPPPLITLPPLEQRPRGSLVKLLQAQVEANPWGDGDEATLEALNLG